MTIHDVVLFVSSTSQACVPPVHFIRENSLPARLVRLDTNADRTAASRGKFFQIHTVPTLLVTYNDGNIQLFAGQEKVLMWLQQALEMTNQAQNHTLTSVDSDEEEQRPKRKSKSKKKRKVTARRSPPPPKNMYGGKSKKKKRPDPVEFIEEDSEDEVEIEFLDEPEPAPRGRRAPPPPTEGLMVGGMSMSKKKSQMGSIYDVAKQMERERQSTLGYREEDLPVS